MSYIDQSLGKDERLLGRAQLAWLYRVGGLFALVLGLASAAGLLIVGNGVIAYAFAAAVMAATGLATYLTIMIPVWTTEIGITNQRLIVKRGFLGRETEELELWSIEEVDLQQGPLDRLLGFGHLIVCGTGDDDMRLPLISDALAFRKNVQQAINEARPDHRVAPPQ